MSTWSLNPGRRALLFSPTRFLTENCGDLEYFPDLPFSKEHQKPPKGNKSYSFETTFI